MRARDLMMTAGDKNTYLVALRDFLIAKYIIWSFWDHGWWIENGPQVRRWWHNDQIITISKKGRRAFISKAGHQGFAARGSGSNVEPQMISRRFANSSECRLSDRPRIVFTNFCQWISHQKRQLKSNPALIVIYAGKSKSKIVFLRDGSAFNLLFVESSHIVYCSSFPEIN